MKAVVYHGKGNISVDEVEMPTLKEPTDAIIKVTSAAICGSDLHMFDGYLVGMKEGDILGHEFVGEVVEVGEAVQHVEVGERVLAPFNIACGECFFCKKELWSLCDRSNPNDDMAEKLYGQSPSGLFGYTHLFGGFSGGQAEYVRVPYAHVGLFPIPAEMPDEKAIFLTDVFPTGFMAAENTHVQPGETVAIWGAGPVGLFAAVSLKLMNAGRIIMIDRVPERLAIAAQLGAETINFEEEDDLIQQLKDMTEGRGPDRCIDAVGMEAESGVYDTIKHTLRLETDKPAAIRQAIQACRKGGTVSIPGMYAGFVDTFPLGVAFNKGLSLHMGQTHTHRYVKKLMQYILDGTVDPSFIVTDIVPLEQAPTAYEKFRDKKDGCVKVILKP